MASNRQHINYQIPWDTAIWDKLLEYGQLFIYVFFLNLTDNMVNWMTNTKKQVKANCRHLNSNIKEKFILILFSHL